MSIINIFFVSFCLCLEFVFNFVHILLMFEDGIDATNLAYLCEPNQGVKSRVKFFCEVKAKNMLLFLCRCLSWRLGWSRPCQMNFRSRRFNHYDSEFVNLFCARLAKTYNENRPDFIEMYNCDE